jgi:hypothetical protein
MCLGQNITVVPHAIQSVQKSHAECSRCGGAGILKWCHGVGRQRTSGTIVASKPRSFEYPFFLPAVTAALRVTNLARKQKTRCADARLDGRAALFGRFA